MHVRKQPPPAEPSAEFMGRARALRRQLIAWQTRYDPLMAKIATEVSQAWWRRSASLPLREMERIASRWRAIGSDEGCLSQSVELGAGRRLSIKDVRFVASECKRDYDPRMPRQKERDAQVFCTVENVVVLGKQKPCITTKVVFGITLDAIASWYQSAFEPSFDRLMSEMAALAKVDPPEDEEAFTIPAGGGGGWLARSA